MGVDPSWDDDDGCNVPSGAMQEICTQLGELWRESRRQENRILELEMRVGMHDPDHHQMDLF